MKVAELAKSLGTTADTVRYYTRLGLLKPAKSVNGYKSYSNKEVSRLKFIVADIKEIINESEDGKSACPLVRSLIKERLEETEKQFQAMLALRGKMSSALSRWEEMEDKAPTANMVCHLIENFEQIKKA